MLTLDGLKSLGRERAGLIWLTVLALGLALAMMAFSAFAAKSGDHLKGANVLVFSKTVGYRHESISSGQAALKALAEERGFRVIFSEDASLFRDDVLGGYDAIIFLNTTGDILDDNQQAAFERFIRSGKGLLGVHSATDTESDGKWPWYTQLIGAHFKAHPEIQEARLLIADPQHPSIAADPALVEAKEFRFTDEWYDFRDVNPVLHHIIRIDNDSYKGAVSKGINPMVWSNTFDGGRAFYIGMGHRHESYDAPLMKRLLTDGLIYAVGPHHH